MSKPIKLRIRTPNTTLIIDILNEESSVEDLQRVLEEKAQMPKEEQQILNGYPPKGLYNSKTQTHIEITCYI